jgi:NAD+ diphosphatase
VIAPGFTGSPLDRADRLRHDEAALAAVVADPASRLLCEAALDPEVAGDRLVWTGLDALRDGAQPLLLGLIDGVAHFVASHPDDRAAVRTPELMQRLATLRREDAATYAAARSLVDWHARHRFCSVCGNGTHIFRAGWGRHCPVCGADHFPRTDPVVIMIAEHRGRALLGRQPSFPPGRYSALAGFLEPGESIEEAVAREIVEESGIRVGNVRYIASQPWPFPSSLMIACVADAENDDIVLDPHELEDAMWVSREEVRAVLAGEPGRFLAPPPYAIAHTLLTVWAQG